MTELDNIKSIEAEWPDELVAITFGCGCCETSEPISSPEQAEKVISAIIERHLAEAKRLVALRTILQNDGIDALKKHLST